MHKQKKREKYTFIRMKHLLVGLLLFFSLGVYSQLITDSLLIEGHYRSFHFNKPVKDARSGSLLFLMHGSGGNGKNLLQHTAKLEAMAAGENLLIAYPDGYRNYWNECRKYATSAANRENINENAFFEAMIGYFQKNYHIDDRKVFAAGFSGGGHMAYKLGLTMPGRIHAIAAIVANLPDSASNDCTSAGKALPVLIINGTLDNTNPYEGGEMFVNNASYGVVRSTKNTFRYWAVLAGYSGVPAKQSLPDTDPADGKTIERYTYRQPGKPEVVLLKVIGGRHDYPGDIDVYVYAWDFFKSQLQTAISMPDPYKKTEVAEAACGQCQFGLPGKGCALAVRINGKAYFVDGTDIDSHGDAHAKDGFCNAISKAEVQGEIVNNRFVATYFRLVSQADKKNKGGQ
jgi:polyhydroxybutyrate depolymerase